MVNRHAGKNSRKRVLFSSAFIVAMLGLATTKFQPIDFSLTSLYLRYQELGFVKRGLLGTSLSPILPDLITPSQAHMLIAAIGILAIAAACIVLCSLYSDNQPFFFRIALILSPGMFLQMGSLYSFLDIYCFLCLLPSVLICISSKPTVSNHLLLFTLGVAGPLFHELYLLAFFPLSLFFAANRSRSFTLTVLSAGLLAAVLISLFGSYENGVGNLIATINSHFTTPIKVSTFELTSELSKNTTGTVDYLFIRGEAIRSIPGIIYLFLLASSLRDKARKSRIGIDPKWIAFSPLLLSLLGGDLSRWLGMTCMNLFLLGITGYLLFEIRSISNKVCLLAFTFLGPIGVGASFPIVHWKLVQALG